jgi:TRAP-type C4-dicarboxylate transport system permease small subunit
VLEKGSRAGRAFGRGFDLLALAAGWALFALSILVGFEVVARKLFAFSLKGVDEVGGYVLAVASAVGFIYALVQHGHIRVNVVFRYFGPRLRALLHLTAYVTLAAFAVLLAWRGVSVWLRSISLDAVAPTPLATPLWIPQGAWILGLIAFAALGVALAMDLGWTLLRKGAAAVERRFHADRMLEELEAERRSALRRAAGFRSPPP